MREGFDSPIRYQIMDNCNECDKKVDSTHYFTTYEYLYFFCDEHCPIKFDGMECDEEHPSEEFLKAREVMGEEGVLLAQDDQLIRLFPDDTFNVVKELEPRTKVPTGTKIRLR
jgi:YHS domain-containing protein